MTARRALRAALITLSVLAALAFVSVGLVLGTAPGRALLLSRALAALEGTIPGRVRVGALDHLSPLGVELRELSVLDPTGREVLRLDRLDLEVAPFALAERRVVVRRLELDGGLVDLTELERSDRGLIAAFVDPNAPPAPPSEEPPPEVRLDVVQLRGLELRAPHVDPIGAIVVRELEVDAELALDGAPRGHVRRLTAGLERAGAALGRIEHTELQLRPGATSELTTRMTLAGVTLALEASGVAPPAQRWQHEPAHALVQIEGVSATALATLLDAPELALAFDGEATLELELGGAPSALDVRAELESAAGQLSLGGRVLELTRPELELSTPGLVLSRLRPELPAQKLAFRLALGADAKDPEAVPVLALLRDARAGEHALPDLDVRATVTRTRAEAIDVVARAGESRLALSGDAGFDGSAQLALELELHGRELERIGALVGEPLAGELDATLAVSRRADAHLTLDGQVSARALAARAARVGRADLSFALAGAPPALGGNLRLSAHALRSGEHSVPRVTLELSGSPERLRARADGELAAQRSGGLGPLRTALDLTLEPQSDAVVLWGKARGTLQGAPFSLALARTRASAERVQSRGVTLTLADQTLRVRGALGLGSPGKAPGLPSAALELESDALDLGKLARLGGLELPLQGRAELRASVRGELERPSVELDLRGEGVALGERPPLDLRVAGQLDAPRGQAALSLDARAAQAGALVLGLEATSALSRTLPLAAALARAEHDVTLRLEALELAFLEAWLQRPLGARGRLRAQARAQGRADEPTLEARLGAELALGASAKRLSVQQELRYAKGELESELALDDARGRWLDLRAALRAGGGERALERVLADPERALAGAALELEAKLAERALGELPLELDTPPPVALGGTLTLAREPEREPRAALAVALRQTAAFTPMPGCTSSDGSARLSARLDDGRLRAALAAHSGERPLLSAQVDAEARLSPLLEGQPFTLGAVSARLDAERVDLAKLPLACRRAAGTLSAKAQLDDVLGPKPELALTLDARGLRLGAGGNGLDLSARARADQRSAALEAMLVAPEGRSRLEARLPIEWSEGRLTLRDDAQLDARAELRRLPIAPLLDPRGGLSYASGSVSGDVALEGTRAAPKLSGRVSLEDVAFTATSLAQPLSNIRGSIAFDERSLRLEGLEATDRDGKLRLDGDIELGREREISARLELSAREFPLRQEGQVVAIADVDAVIDSTVGPARTTAVVRLERADTWIEEAGVQRGLPLAPHPDFVIDGRAPPTAADGNDSGNGDNARARAGAGAPTDHGARAPRGAPPAQPDARVTELVLDASDRFWVKRDDFAVKLATKLDVRIQGERVRVLGKVDIDRGYLSLLGKVFTLEKDSHLEFTGSERPDPRVAISATHENRRSGDRIRVQIGGRGSRPELVFFVNDAEVTAGQAFLAIYESQQSNQRPEAAGDQARQFVGGLAAGLLATSARRELGAAAPIIMVEPGAETGQGRVRAGLELDSLVPGFLRNLVTGVYFEGIVARESDDPEQRDASVQGGALLELYFPQGFFSTGQYGPGTTWSLDFGWQL